MLFSRSFWANLGLQTKMGLLVATGLIALVGIFGLLGLAAARETTDRALQERVLLAQLTARHVDYVLGNVQGLLQSTAGQPAIALANPAPAARQEALRDALGRAGQALQHILLTDANGKVVAAGPPLPVDTSLSQAVSPVLQGASFSTASVDLFLLGPTVIVAVPVRDPAGQLTGVLAACLNLTWPEMQEFLQSVTLGETGYLEIVDSGGLILLSTQSDRLLTKADHGDSLVAMIRAGQGKVATCHRCHDSAQGPEKWPEVMAFAPLKRAPWGVVVRQAEEEAFASSTQLQGRVVLLGVIAVIGAMVLVWLTTRSVIDPVQDLMAAAVRIADGDLATPIAARGRDEIGTLTRTLDDMRSRLQASMAEIQALNRDLDVRVQERTQECMAAQVALLQRNRELAALNVVAMAVTQPLHLDELLGQALEEVLHVTDVDVGAIFLLREETGILELQTYRGTSEEAAQAMIRLHVSDGDCGGVLQKGQPVVIPDLRHYRLGARALHQAGILSLVHVPLVTRGTPLGTLCVGTRCLRDFSRQEVDLLMAIGNQIAVGVENARLYAELARRKQLRGELLEKVITAQEEERKRVARDLHDDTSQTLTALIYSLEAAESTSRLPEMHPTLAAMRQLATQALEGVHKVIFDLRPSVLDHLGLIVALRWYAETRLQPLGTRLHIVEQGCLQHLPPQMETALFRVAQEAINNIARHAGARHVNLTFDCRDSAVCIDIEDDGVGFDQAEVARSTDQRRGLGLVGMQERVGLLGGELVLVTGPGMGTHIAIHVPLPAR